MSNVRNFLYRLFFTRDDDLDLLQVFFLLLIIFFIVAFSFAGMGKWSVTNMAWSAFISIFATLAIAGSPKWVAELLAKRNTNQYGGYGGYGGGGGYMPPDPPSDPNNEEAEIG